jgi:PIN domain nuclease of toxin-antitoxin system
LREAERHGEPVAFSAITLLEIAVLVEHGIARIKITIEDLLNKIASDPLFEILPFTVEIAAEVAAVGPSLRDPGDRAIVATARVHRFILLTSDQRIIESKLVPTVS